MSLAGPLCAVGSSTRASRHSKKLYAGVEANFWWQKYQIPDSPVFDTDQAAVSLLLKYHF